MEINIRSLDEIDRPYALVSWRKSHHQGPDGMDMPWSRYKAQYGQLFRELLNHRSSLVLGAYNTLTQELLGFLVATPGKRVHTLHWTQVKFKNKAGEPTRRKGIMIALLQAADLGSRFVYTLRARRHNETTLDLVLVEALAKHNVFAAYTPIKDWLQ